MGKKLSIKIGVVGNQGIHLNGTVSMSTQNKCLSNCLTLFWSQHIYITDYKIRVLEKSCQQKQTKNDCFVGNQWNRLNGTVPMSTHNMCLSKYLTICLSTYIYRHLDTIAGKK